MNIVWSVDSMSCYPQSQGNVDVVYEVYWRCTGNDGDANASVYGSCVIPYAGGEFTPYQDLTQQEVLGWVWANGVNQSEIEASITAQVNAILNPTSITPPLPWSQ